jgi:Flp pilus assembly protein TadG
VNNRLLTILAIASKTKPASCYRERGQSLIEFSLIFPLLFLLIVNVVNFGSFMYDWITVASAARAGAQYMITGGASVFGPDTPIGTQVRTLITNDISSLPNKSSLVVAVCTNNSGVALTGTTLCTSTDPETSSPIPYTIAQIDVTYTYTPMIPLWKFPGLGVNATLPTTTIHRAAVMRVLI